MGATLLRLLSQTCCTQSRSGTAGRELLRGLFALEHVTRLHDAGRIDRDVSFINVPDYAFFINQEGRTIAKTLLLVEDAVVFDDGAFEIAE